MFLSNTWGDRSRDARINEQFMLREIAAAARLGVDVIQIDDGWQKGRSANSAGGKGVWNGYWATDPECWTPDARRFPNELAPGVGAAGAKGMKFGLWYGPPPATTPLTGSATPTGSCNSTTSMPSIVSSSIR
jgi:alpha-galactosidase